MATTPSAFFSTDAKGSELSTLIKSLPANFRGFSTVQQGSALADTFLGTNKNEIFVVTPGDKIFAGGGGYDAVITSSSFGISSSSGIEAVKLTGLARANVTGSSADNAILGNDANNIIKAGGGDDAVVAGAGIDRVLGGSGADSIHGGKGIDTLFGDSGNDRLDGGFDNDRVFGGTGDDVITGGLGNDIADGGTGNDRIQGGAGNDVIKGSSGDDRLFGDAGDDILFGGAGKDSLVGGAGEDILRGNAGADRFVMGSERGAIDVIADFQAGVDVIDIAATKTTSFAQLRFKDDGDGTIVTAKDGTKFKLLGFDPDDMDASFFDFK